MDMRNIFTSLFIVVKQLEKKPVSLKLISRGIAREPGTVVDLNQTVKIEKYDLHHYATLRKPVLQSGPLLQRVSLRSQFYSLGFCFFLFLLKFYYDGVIPNTRA